MTAPVTGGNRPAAPATRYHATDAGQKALLLRYATAFEDKDMATLLALLRQDAATTR